MYKGEIMQVSIAGKSKIKSHEGLRLKAYPDPGTGGAPWTIGYGHTGPEVKPGMVISQKGADDYFDHDISKFESGVNKLITKSTQGQFDALVSFAYNVGLGNLKSSTLLKKHNASDYAGAANEFGRWNKAAGKVMPGLTARRAEEAEMYKS